MISQNAPVRTVGDIPSGHGVAEERWYKFKERCHLEKRTGMSIEDQAKVEKIPERELQLICNQYRDGTHMSQIHRFIKFHYDIQTDSKSLARYWRRTLSGFREAENQRREYRTTERALKSTTQF